MCVWGGGGGGRGLGDDVERGRGRNRKSEQGEREGNDFLFAAHDLFYPMLMLVLLMQIYYHNKQKMSRMTVCTDCEN